MKTEIEEKENVVSNKSSKMACKTNVELKNFILQKL